MNEAEEVQLRLICKISAFFHYPNTIPILGLYIGISLPLSQYYPNIGVIYWDNGKENRNYKDYRDYIRT